MYSRAGDNTFSNAVENGLFPMLQMMLLFWTCMLLKLCVLLCMFDDYFENVRFAHRALTRPFPSSSIIIIITIIIIIIDTIIITCL